MNTENSGGGVVVVVAAALVIRSLVAMSAFAVNGAEHFVDNSDSVQYLALATSLASGDGLIFGENVAPDIVGWYSAPEAGVPDVVRTPGYPLFIALGTLAGYPVAITIALQLLLGAVSAGLVYQIARRVTSSGTVALWAGLLYAADPLSVLHTTYVMSETLFTTVFLTHLLFLYRYADTGSPRSAALAGTAAALAVLIRPIAFYWPLIATLILLLIPAARHSRRLLAVAVSVFALTAAGPLVAWTARNATNGYWGFSAMQDVNLYRFIGASIRAEADGTDWPDVQDDLDAELNQLTTRNDWTRTERYEYMRRASVQMIAQNPAAGLRVYVRAVARVLAPTFSPYVGVFVAEYTGQQLVQRLLSGTAPPFRDYWFALPIYAILLLMCVGYYALAVIGAWRVGPPVNLSVALLLGSMAYFLVLAAGVGNGSYDRMRCPAMPMICVFAAAGLSFRGRGALPMAGRLSEGGAPWRVG